MVIISNYICHNSTKTTYWGHCSLKIFWEQFSDKQILVIILPVVKLCAVPGTRPQNSYESSSNWMVTIVDMCSSLFMERCRKSAHWRGKYSQDRNYDWTKSVLIYKANSYLELKVFKESESDSVVSDSLRPHGLCSPWNSLGQNTGVGSLSLLQGIFPTQGSNPGLLHCMQILYQLSHKGSPKILKWVPYLFSSRSFWPRNQTGVSCIVGGFFTNWSNREALKLSINFSFWVIQECSNLELLWKGCSLPSLSITFKALVARIFPSLM